MYLAAVGKLAGALKKPHRIKGVREGLAAENSSAQLPQAHLGSSFCQRVSWAWAQMERWETELGFALLSFPALGLVLGNSIQWWFGLNCCLI